MASTVCFRDHKAKLLYAAVTLTLAACAGGTPSLLSSDPTPTDFLRIAGDDTSLVAAGRYTIGGKSVSCGTAPTVLYPRLNDYAESFPKFIVVRPDLMAKAATPVKLWIYYHECGHVMRGPDGNAADCYGVQRGVKEGWLTTHGMDQI
jgi:hypothetical protein